MTPTELNGARKEAGLTQERVAEAVSVSQAYWSLLETGARRLTEPLAKKVAKVLSFRPTALPLDEPKHRPRATENPSEIVAREVAALGYAGFSHLRGAEKRNPAAVLLMGLAQKDLESRVVESLPWLVVEYPDLNWDWLVARTKQEDLQNRLGFVVNVARRVSESKGRDGAKVLAGVESLLERARLAREDTLCRDSVTQAERNWLRQMRPPQAEHWNLLTDLRPETLRYGP